MSLASIWIFTLGLPWTLGADFFIRHLFDGDPASNTLGWRWVAGLQTRGKPYLASAEAIAACTDGRFRPAPEELAMSARQIDGPENPPPGAPPEQARFDPAVPTAFLLHEDDLSPDWLFRSGLAPLGTGVLGASTGLTPLRMAPRVLAFREALARDAADRLGPSLGSVQTLPPDPAAIATWARNLGARQIVTAYAPVGAVRDVLDRVEGLPVIRPLRDDDLRTWPHATAGYFKFRKRIPEFLDALDSVRAA
jgi:deoxyribodipyrimidine photo-lyase